MFKGYIWIMSFISSITFHPSPPKVPESGDAYFDTVSDAMKVYSGTNWVQMGVPIPIIASMLLEERRNEISLCSLKSQLGISSVGSHLNSIFDLELH